jgi:protein-disulfide isomerase
MKLLNMKNLLSCAAACAALAFAPFVIAQDSVKGSADAPVAILAFSAYACPYCAEANQQMAVLQKRFGDRLQIIYKQYPLGTNQAAYLPHEAALAAGEQGKYWEMHERLFAVKGELTPAKVLEIAKDVRLDVARFDQALKERRFKKDVDRDVAEAKALKVRASPTFYVDGLKLEGLQNIESFEQIIQFRLSGQRPEPPVSKPSSIRDIATQPAKN